MAAAAARRRRRHLDALQQLEQGGAGRLLPPPDLTQQGLAQRGVQGALRRGIVVSGAQVGGQQHAQRHIGGLDSLHGWYAAQIAIVFSVMNVIQASARRQCQPCGAGWQGCGHDDDHLNAAC